MSRTSENVKGISSLVHEEKESLRANRKHGLAGRWQTERVPLTELGERRQKLSAACRWSDQDESRSQWKWSLLTPPCRCPALQPSLLHRSHQCPHSLLGASICAAHLRWLWGLRPAHSLLILPPPSVTQPLSSSASILYLSLLKCTLFYMRFIKQTYQAVGLIHEWKYETSMKFQVHF